MDYSFIYCILALIVTCLIVLLYKNKEHFEDKLGFFSFVDKDEYHAQYFGPKCLAKCIQEHGAVINYYNKDKDGYKLYNDPLEWNRKNPTKGYCFTANDDKFPFLCESDKCKEKCKNPIENETEYTYDNADDSKYDPTNDYHRCIIDDSNPSKGCVEKKLNIITGDGCQSTLNCYECVKNYWKNINTFKDEVIDEIIEEHNELCKSDTS